MRCHRCQGAAEPGRNLCVPCAGRIRDEVGKSALSELARYWERRVMEGRSTDWT